ILSLLNHNDVGKDMHATIMESGCTSSPIFQENHSESNAGQIPSCVDHDRQESGKRKAEVPGMRASTSLGVMDQTYGIKHQRRRNKDSDLEHGSEIINLCPTANLLDEVERLLRENPDPANLEKAKSILKVQEKDLLDALVKLSEASYDAVYFSANGQPGNTHDDGKADEEVLPNPANSSDETPPVTTRQAGAGAGNHVKIQGVAATALPLSTAPPSLMQTRPSLAPASPSSAPAALGESSRGLSTAHQPHAQPVVVGSASAPPAPSKTRLIITKRKTTAEQRWRMWEFAHRVGWSIQKAGADAVDAFCAQVGVPERALRNWMANNRRLAKVPPPSSPPPRSIIKRTKTTAEQRKRMREFAYRVGWSIQKAGADAVDAFCAQVGVPERALRNWMANNSRLAKVPPPPSPPPRSIIKRTKTTAEQRKRMREFAYRVGWSIQKAGAGAVDALCAQVGVPECALRNWMANNRHLANVPPPSLSSPPLPSHHQVQDHPPADTPPQGSMTEQGKSPEPEAAAAPADDGAGKGDEDEEASEVTQRGRGHRARKPNKCYADSFWM
uniref:Homeobox domain-containing protein n=1 Tax=Setaria italica TaxID=4555 RepID=A0A0Q3N2I4_SETIT